MLTQRQLKSQRLPYVFDQVGEDAVDYRECRMYSSFHSFRGELHPPREGLYSVADSSKQFQYSSIARFNRWPEQVAHASLPVLLEDAWITRNPGTQHTGSFNPTHDDFFAGVYE